MKKLDLYPHNQISDKEIKKAYKKGERIVGLVKATGTGKSYIGLQLALDNKDKKTIYVVPNRSIIEHLKKIIEENSLSLENDFPNLELRTYQDLANKSDEELANLECELLIIDEFHHIGAPVWGERINKLVETHPNMLIFGMTAYTVRDRGTSYERNMANPYKNELFSNKIVHRYDLVDAMIDGVLPSVIYKTTVISLIDELEKELEQKIQKDSYFTKKEYNKYTSIIDSGKKRVHEANQIANIFRKNIVKDGKYIYFCPVNPEEGINDIETIKQETLNYLKEFIDEENIIFYESTSKDEKNGKLNRESFYNDTDLDGNSAKNKLRIIFVKNQYNEGVHAPNVYGVILGRGTKSDIIAFEQIGRALSSGEDTIKLRKQLEYIKREDLLQIAKYRELKVSDDMTKEDLIEKLLSKTIIDLAGNYKFIKELQDNIKDRIRKRSIKTGRINDKHQLRKVNFDIEIEEADLLQSLLELKDRTNHTLLEKRVEIFMKYINTHDIPQSDSTIKFIDLNENIKDTILIGRWLDKQKQKNLENFINELSKYQYIYPEAYTKITKNINKLKEIRNQEKLSFEKKIEIFMKYINTHKMPLTTSKLKFSDIDKSVTDKSLIIVWLNTQRQYNLSKLITEYSKYKEIYPKAYQQITSNIKRYKETKNKKVLTYEEKVKTFMEYINNSSLPTSTKNLRFNNITPNTSDTTIISNWFQSQKQVYLSKFINECSKYKDIYPEAYQKILANINQYKQKQAQEKFTFERKIELFMKHINNDEIPSTQHKLKFSDIAPNISNTALIGYWFDHQKQTNLTNFWNECSKYKDIYPEAHKKLTININKFLNNRNQLKLSFEERVAIFMKYTNNTKIPHQKSTLKFSDLDETVTDTTLIGSWLSKQKQENISNFIQECSKYKEIYPKAYEKIITEVTKYQKRKNEKKLTFEEKIEAFMKYINKNDIPSKVTDLQFSDIDTTITDSTKIGLWLHTLKQKKLKKLIEEISKYKEIYPNAYQKIADNLNKNKTLLRKERQLFIEELKKIRDNLTKTNTNIRTKKL